jgi:hypothetical protein
MVGVPFLGGLIAGDVPEVEAQCIQFLFTYFSRTGGIQLPHDPVVAQNDLWYGSDKIRQRDPFFQLDFIIEVNSTCLCAVFLVNPSDTENLPAVAAGLRRLYSIVNQDS